MSHSVIDFLSTGRREAGGRKSPEAGLLMHALDTFYDLCLWLHELGITLLWIAHLVRALTLPLYKVKWVNWWIQKLMLFPCNCLITYLNLCWYEMPWPKMHVFVKFCWDSSLGYSSGLINFKRMKNCSHFLVWLHIWNNFFIRWWYFDQKCKFWFSLVGIAHLVRALNLHFQK